VALWKVDAEVRILQNGQRLQKRRTCLQRASNICVPTIKIQRQVPHFHLPAYEKIRNDGKRTSITDSYDSGVMHAAPNKSSTKHCSKELSDDIGRSSNSIDLTQQEQRSSDSRVDVSTCDERLETVTQIIVHWNYQDYTYPKLERLCRPRQQ